MNGALGIFLFQMIQFAITREFTIGMMIIKTLHFTVIVAIAIYLSIKRFKPAYFFLVAWLSPMISYIIALSIFWGYPLISADTSLELHIHLIGPLFQLILMGFAMGYKTKQNEQEALAIINEISKSLFWTLNKPVRISSPSCVVIQPVIERNSRVRV